MIQKKFSKLIGLKYEDFLAYQESGQVVAQEARLIPLLKTGDEGALTSIFMSAVRLVREYRDSIFKELKLPKSGTPMYFTEVAFKGLDAKSRVDGLIIIVSKGIIKDAVVFEMKNKTKWKTKNKLKKVFYH